MSAVANAKYRTPLVVLKILLTDSVIFSVAKVAIIVYDMSVSVLQGGFEPILQ